MLVQEDMKHRDNKKEKITIDQLARMSQGELRAIQKKMVTKDDLKVFATKDDLKLFATRADLVDLRDTVVDAVREENLKVLQSNDKVMTKLDTLLKEDAAHTGAHKRFDDTLHKHDQRLKKLEGATK
jgi:hypothetical protein